MASDLLPVTTELIATLSARAAGLPRLRSNHNLHPTLEDPIQRLLNAFEPGTYVRPHRHVEPERWELFLCLHGRAAVLTFDDSGSVQERLELDATGPTFAVEIAGGVWHTIASLAHGTVMFELKPGPYAPLSDKCFATWAPAEGAAGTADLVRWFERAAAGNARPG